MKMSRHQETPLLKMITLDINPQFETILVMLHGLCDSATYCNRSFPSQVPSLLAFSLTKKRYYSALLWKYITTVEVGGSVREQVVCGIKFHVQD